MKHLGSAVTFLIGMGCGILLRRFGWYAAIPVALMLTVGIDFLVLGKPADEQCDASLGQIGALFAPIAGFMLVALG